MPIAPPANTGVTATPGQVCSSTKGTLPAPPVDHHVVARRSISMPARPASQPHILRNGRRVERGIGAPADGYRAFRFGQRLRGFAWAHRGDLGIEAPGPRGSGGAVGRPNRPQRRAGDMVGDVQVLARLLRRETKARQRGSKARIVLGRPHRDRLPQPGPCPRAALLA
jgi:hypothetical protein